MFTVAGNTDTVSGNGLEISEKNGVPAWASISAGYQLLLSPLLPWIAGKWKNGIMAYLDYSSLNDVGEPCVIVARFNDVGYQIEETIAEDFGEFILQLVKEQLAD